MYERALVVVPPEAELLVVLHGSSVFVSSFLHRRRDETMIRGRRGRASSLRERTTGPHEYTEHAIDRPSRRYLVLPRPITIAHIEPDNVSDAKVRVSRVLSALLLCSDLQSYPRRGPRGRTTQAEAPQRSAEASKMAVRRKRVGRIALLAFSFVRVLVTVMDCLGGDDAGGRASTAHAQLRPGCAHHLRNNRRAEAPGIQRRRRQLLLPPPPASAMNLHTEIVWAEKFIEKNCAHRDAKPAPKWRDGTRGGVAWAKKIMRIPGMTQM